MKPALRAVSKKRKPQQFECLIESVVMIEFEMPVFLPKGIKSVTELNVKT